MSGANLSCLLKKNPHLSFFSWESDHHHYILWMVAKSCTLDGWNMLKPYKSWDKLPIWWTSSTHCITITRLFDRLLSSCGCTVTSYGSAIGGPWPQAMLLMKSMGSKQAAALAATPVGCSMFGWFLDDVRWFLRMFDDFFVIFDWGCWWLFDDFRWFVDDYLMFIEMQTRSFRGWTFGAKKSGHIHIRWIDMNIQKLNWEIIKSNLCLRFSYGNAQVFWVNSVNAHGTMTGGWTSRTTTGYHGSRRPPGEFERLNPGCGWLVGGDWNHGILWLSKNSWEWSHHPNWRSPSFFKGVGQPPTTWSFFVVETTGFARLI